MKKLLSSLSQDFYLRTRYRYICLTVQFVKFKNIPRPGPGPGPLLILTFWVTPPRPYIIIFLTKYDTIRILFGQKVQENKTLSIITSNQLPPVRAVKTTVIGDDLSRGGLSRNPT